MAPRSLERHVQDLELPLQVTDGGAQDDAPGGEEVEGGELLGEHHGMAIGEHQHVGENLDPLGGAGQHGGGADRLGKAGTHHVGSSPGG